jgi:hypothetical protein
MLLNFNNHDETNRSGEFLTTPLAYTIVHKLRKTSSHLF